MALEERTQHSHIDIFSEDGVDVSPVNINGKVVYAKSPEQLFVDRFQQIKRIIEDAENEGKVEIPKKIFQYFYLNGEIADFARLQKLVESRGYQGNAQEAVLALHRKLQSGLQSGEYVLIDKYH